MWPVGRTINVKETTMSLRINTNVSALNAYNNLNRVSKQTESR